MKLLTKALEKRIPKLYSTEELEDKDKRVVCKFFNPCGIGTWYVLEGDWKDDDYIFFGVIEIQERELGYFSLKELESLKLPWGMKIERDRSFYDKPLNTVLKRR